MAVKTNETADRKSQQSGSAAAPEATAVSGKGRAAAHRVLEKNAVKLNIPGVGTVTLPSHAHLAWYCGLVTVAAFGIIDWPVAAVLAVGHLLAQDEHHRLLHDFGEALSEA